MKWLARVFKGKLEVKLATSTINYQEIAENLNRELDNARTECFQLAQLVRHHEQRIKEMAPEKQFRVRTVNNITLEQEHVYSTAGHTQITVRLPAGHPWKEATELARELELAKVEVQHARNIIGTNPEMRRTFLGLDHDKVIDAAAEKIHAAARKLRLDNPKVEKDEQ